MSRRTALLATLALSGFVTSFGAHVVATNLPTYAESVGAGAFTIGMLIAVYLGKSSPVADLAPPSGITIVRRR